MNLTRWEPLNPTRWDPFRELEEMSARLSRLFNQPIARQLADYGGMTLADWIPAVDLQETDGEYVIKADLPEVKKDDVKVDDAKVDDKASGSGEKDEELIKGVMAILKSANSEGAKAALASLESQFGEKKVEKTEVANVIKSMVPDIAKQIEEPLRKSLDETKAELEDIRKSNAMLIGEKVEREIEEISKSLVGDSTENKEYLRLMKAKCSPEEFDKVVKREKARSETIRKAGTFRETGSSGYGTSSGGSAYQQLSEIANGYIQKSGNEKLTFNDAFAKAVAEREDLWDEYRNSAYANRSRED